SSFVLFVLFVVRGRLPSPRRSPCTFPNPRERTNSAAGIVKQGKPSSPGPSPMNRHAFLPLALLLSAGPALADELPKLTSLSDAKVKYRVPEKAHVTLKRGGVEAVLVDNRAVDDDVLKGHKAGYSGVASLRGAGRKDNLFVPAYAGLNFEHVHDG